MELPIRLEGGSNRILSPKGECIAEASGGFLVAAALIRATNTYPYAIELLKQFLAGDAPVEEAKNLLAYLGEKS
jgi:hypothetical protein